MTLDDVALRVVQHQLQLFLVDRAAAALVQRLDQRQRARRLQLAALDAEVLLAPRDDDVEPLLDRAQVLVENATDMREAFVVGWGEGAADDHVGLCVGGSEARLSVQPIIAA